MRGYFVLLLVGATAIAGMRIEPPTPPPKGDKYFWKFVADCDYFKSNSAECKDAREMAHHFKLHNLHSHNFVNRTAELMYKDYKISHPETSKLRTMDRRQVCEFYYLPNTEYFREFTPIKKVDGGFHQSSLVLCKGLKEGTDLNTPANCLKSCVDMFPLYNWNEANGQNSWSLPEELGYLVGPDTEYKFIGIASDYDEEAHGKNWERYNYNSYRQQASNNVRNGIRVGAARKLEYEPEVKVGLFMTGGHDDIVHGGELPAIPPRQKAFQSGKICPLEVSQSVSAFQYSVHAHPTATDISLYIHSTETNTTVPIFHIQNPHPRTTEKYIPFEHEITIKPTDRIVVKCTYNTMAETQPFHTGCWLRWMELCAVDIWYKTTSRSKDDLALKCIENSIYDKHIWETTN